MKPSSKLSDMQEDSAPGLHEQIQGKHKSNPHPIKQRQ